MSDWLRIVLVGINSTLLLSFLLILSTQFKQMTTDKKVEDKSEVPEKTAEEKKNDSFVCLNSKVRILIFLLLDLNHYHIAAKPSYIQLLKTP